MGTLIRLGRVLSILLLGLMAVSFVIGIGRPETGLIEKAALLALIGVCVFLAARATALAERLQHRLRH